MGIDLPRPMNPKYALKQLKLMVEKLIREGFSNPVDDYLVDDWRTILVSDVGTNKENVVSGSLFEVSNYNGGFIHSIIFPASMSENEKEAFERRKK